MRTAGGLNSTVSLHRYLDDDLTVIVLTNCQGAGPNEIAEGVARVYVPELAESPVFLSAAAHNED